LNVGGVGGARADWLEYFARNAGSQKKAFGVLRNVSRQFDAAHGTSILQQVKQSIRLNQYIPIP
jgi:hypothetical protein